MTKRKCIKRKKTKKNMKGGICGPKCVLAWQLTKRTMDKDKDNALNLFLFYFLSLCFDGEMEFTEFLYKYQQYFHVTHLADAYIKYNSKKLGDGSIRLLELICMNPDDFAKSQNVVVKKFVVKRLEDMAGEIGSNCKVPCTNMEACIGYLNTFFVKIIHYLRDNQQYPTIFTIDELEQFLGQAESRGIDGLQDYLRKCIESSKTLVSAEVLQEDDDAKRNNSLDFLYRPSESPSAYTSVFTSPSSPNPAQMIASPSLISFAQKNGYNVKEEHKQFIPGQKYWLLEPDSKNGLSEGKILIPAGKGESCPLFSIRYMDKNNELQERTENRCSSEQAFYHDKTLFQKLTTRSLKQFPPSGGRKTIKKRKRNRKKLM
jgi:hypothetical protein